jgi:ParB family chromosome partitioning protein
VSASSKGRKGGLGRGLGALIVSTEAAPEAAEGTQAAQGAPPGPGVQTLPLAALAPNPRQPRTRFDEASLAELAASIREHGIIQPLIVTAAPQQPGAYWLVAGERRWRAAQLAGLSAAPVLVREANPQQLVELALIENVQRADLNPLEEAHAYQALLDEFGLTQAELAERVGKSRPAIANAVRLLQLPPAAQAAVVEGTVSAGHARALLALESAAQIEQALAVVVGRELNVRQTEALVRRVLEEQAAAGGEPARAPALDEQTRAQAAHMEERFRRALGTRVSLARNADGSGRLVVHFYNDGDLEALYALIAGPESDLEGN